MSSSSQNLRVPYLSPSGQFLLKPLLAITNRCIILWIDCSCLLLRDDATSGYVSFGFIEHSWRICGIWQHFNFRLSLLTFSLMNEVWEVWSALICDMTPKYMMGWVGWSWSWSWSWSWTDFFFYPSCMVIFESSAFDFINGESFESRSNTIRYHTHLVVSRVPPYKVKKFIPGTDRYFYCCKYLLRCLFC